MDPTHQWLVFDTAAVDTPSHAGAKHGEVALRKKCLWRPPAELLVELQTRPRCSLRLRGKLTDDDLDRIAGKRDQLEGKIQERYGIEKDRVRRDVDDWYSRQGW